MATAAHSLPDAPRPLRLADLVASVSLATDLATGQVLEHGLRRALLAVWLGEEIGVRDEDLSEVYYVALLGTVGCALEAAAFAPYVEDEIAVGTRLATVDPTSTRQMASFFLREAGNNGSPARRLRNMVSVAIGGQERSAQVCRDVSMQIAQMLDLAPAVRAALSQCHEQWNGRGPRGLEGEAIRLPTRLYQVARDAEIFSRARGVDAAIDVARARSGSQYDPRIAARFVEVAHHLLARIETESTWQAVLDAEPSPVRRLEAPQFEAMARAIANFVDARSPYTVGHSQAVSTLAEGAANNLGLSADEARTVGRAGLLHDLGRTSVPVTTWDKAEGLTQAERERVRRHPAVTELLLARSDVLGPLGVLAGMHHERLDGSGYRGLTAPFLPTAARLLAAADAYQSKLERRPYREALSPERATDWLRGEAERGRLDHESVRAVLAAAGRPSGDPAAERPAGLTERELDVLRLAVRGLSNREIAESLVVSPKTVGRHIEHIYEKAGVSTRVGATLFALQHGLVNPATVEA